MGVNIWTTLPPSSLPPDEMAKEKIIQGFQCFARYTN